MPMLGTATKQPSETENYSIYYGNDLAASDSFAIAAVTITSPAGDTNPPVVDTYLADVAGQRAKLFISGGTAGTVHKVTVRIQTDSGRVLEDEFKLRIKEY